jgi:hypothetical protein
MIGMHFVRLGPRSLFYDVLMMNRASDVGIARQRSQTLFGARYRVEVGAAIAESRDGIVSIKDLARELGEPPGLASVNAEFKILERAGLLTRIPREPGERRIFLMRQPSAYWALCVELRSLS